MQTIFPQISKTQHLDAPVLVFKGFCEQAGEVAKLGVGFGVGGEEGSFVCEIEVGFLELGLVSLDVNVDDLLLGEGLDCVFPFDLAGNQLFLLIEIDIVYCVVALSKTSEGV
jgi:hypothetical protein